MSSPRDTKERTATAPTPSDAQLLEFLERLFDGDFPEKIELVQLFGQAYRQRGTIIDTKVYKPNAQKPKREELVGLSNQFLILAQKNCNMVGKPQRYGVIAWNTVKHDRPYAAYPLKMEPTGDGMEGAAGGEDDDESLVGRDPHGSDRLLRRWDELAKDDRWRMEKYMSAMGEILKVQGEMIARQSEQVTTLTTKIFDGLKTLEEAHSAIHKRNLEQKLQDFKLEMLRDGAMLVKGLLPPIVNKLAGEKVVEVTESADSMVLKTFFKSLSKEQIEAAFGVFTEDGTQTRTGIFTIDQTRILDGVMQCTMDPAELDQLLPGGAYAVNDAQVAAAQQVFTAGQIMPLLMHLGQRSQAKTPPPPPATKKSDPA